MYETDNIWVKFPKTNSIYQLESFLMDSNLDKTISKEQIHEIIKNNVENDGEYIILNHIDEITIEKQQQKLFNKYKDDEIEYVSQYYEDEIKNNDDIIFSRFFNKINNYHIGIAFKNGIETDINEFNCDYKIIIERDDEILDKFIKKLKNDNFWYIGKKETRYYQNRGDLGKKAYELYFKYITESETQIYNLINTVDELIDIYNEQYIPYHKIYQIKENPRVDYVFITDIIVETLDGISLRTDTDDIVEKEMNKDSFNKILKEINKKKNLKATTINLVSSRKIIRENKQYLSIGIKYKSKT